LTRSYQARPDEGQGHATRDTPSAGKFQRVGKAGPRARFALVRRIRVFSSLTDLLLDLGHAVLEVRELGDGDLVGQDRPPRPELYRLGGGNCPGTFRAPYATRLLGRLGGRASGPISWCCNDMPSEDCRLDGTLRVPQSGTKWHFSSEIPASVH
jgi:hypothetical protein